MAPPNRTRSGTLTGPRPPGQARRPSPVQAYDDSDLGEGDDDEPDGGRRLEEGSASGAETSESGAEYYYREDKMSQRGMRSTGLLTGQSASGTSKEGSEWEELVSKMQDVARRWKRLLQRQGLAAYASSVTEHWRGEALTLRQHFASPSPADTARRVRQGATLRLASTPPQVPAVPPVESPVTPSRGHDPPLSLCGVPFPAGPQGVRAESLAQGAYRVWLCRCHG